MLHAITQTNFIIRELFQTMLQDIDLAAYLHQKSANEAVASDIYSGAMEGAYHLLSVRKTKRHKRRIIVRYPFSISQSSLREVSEQGRQGDERARRLNQDGVT